VTFCSGDSSLKIHGHAIELLWLCLQWNPQGGSKWGQMNGGSGDGSLHRVGSTGKAPAAIADRRGGGRPGRQFRWGGTL